MAWLKKIGQSVGSDGWIVPMVQTDDDSDGSGVQTVQIAMDFRDGPDGSDG